MPHPARYLLFFLLFLLNHYGYSQEVSRSVFASNQGDRKWMVYQDNYRALYRVLFNEASEQLEKRSAYVSTLRTDREWIAYKEELKRKYGASLLKFRKTR